MYLTAGRQPVRPVVSCSGGPASRGGHQGHSSLHAPLPDVQHLQVGAARPRVQGERLGSTCCRGGGRISGDGANIRKNGDSSSDHFLRLRFFFQNDMYRNMILGMDYEERV